MKKIWMMSCIAAACVACGGDEVADRTPADAGSDGRVETGAGDVLDEDVSDDGDVDGRTPQPDRLELKGRIRPGGGVQMSNGYTLTGGVSVSGTGRTSESASFSLEWTGAAQAE